MKMVLKINKTGWDGCCEIMDKIGKLLKNGFKISYVKMNEQTKKLLCCRYITNYSQITSLFGYKIEIDYKLERFIIILEIKNKEIMESKLK